MGAIARRRVFIEDSRSNGAYLRTTWHPEAQQFVVSTWEDTLCTGAVRIPASEAASLIGLLADGLADAASRPAEVVAPAAGPTRWWAPVTRWIARRSGRAAATRVGTGTDADVLPLWKTD